MVWDPFGTIGNAFWLGGAQWAGKMWVHHSPREMAAEAIAYFPRLFEWILDDLRALVSGNPILAEGWGLRPELERAQCNRLERDRLVASDAVASACRLGIPVLEVDGSRDADGVADLVADRFGLGR